MVLFCCLPVVVALLGATLALTVVPSGMPHRGERHVPSSYLRRGSRYSVIWTLGWGLAWPMWLLWAGAPGYYRSIRQLTPSRPELPAALGSYFTHSALGCGPVTEQMLGCRVAAGWLSWCCMKRAVPRAERRESCCEARRPLAMWVFPQHFHAISYIQNRS